MKILVFIFLPSKRSLKKSNAEKKVTMMEAHRKDESAMHYPNVSPVLASPYLPRGRIDSDRAAEHSRVVVIVQCRI
jgi:hypothetical protein